MINLTKVRCYPEDRDYINDCRRGNEKQEDILKRLLKRKVKK